MDVFVSEPSDWLIASLASLVAAGHDVSLQFVDVAAAGGTADKPTKYHVEPSRSHGNKATIGFQ